VPRRLPALVLAATLLVAACGGTSTETPTGALHGQLTVFAAASLTDAFGDLARAFEADNPGVTVTLNLAASSALREQIVAGAPADAFASAGTGDMDQLAVAGEVSGQQQIFARNGITIAVPAGNPGGVTGLADFANPDLLIGLCAAEVPCGRYARTALDSAGVTPSLDSDEPDVRSLLTKIEAGELDAGIVYLTDLASAGQAVEGIPLPDAYAVEATYPIAVLSGAPNPEAAAAFVAFVLSPAGQEILAGYGFLTP
jgi:molybdate transport system substrate-binding protein